MWNDMLESYRPQMTIY